MFKLTAAEGSGLKRVRKQYRKLLAHWKMEFRKGFTRPICLENALPVLVGRWKRGYCYCNYGPTASLFEEPNYMGMSKGAAQFGLQLLMLASYGRGLVGCVRVQVSD